jgi:P-type Ca2+ transporter type 2C
MTTLPPGGLTSVEVQTRLKRDGPNELPSQKRQSVFTLFFRVLSEPMLILLLGAGGLYIALGEVSDALMLLSFVFFVIGVTFIQERRTERTLEKLKDLSSPRAYVIRDNARIRIPGREVVVDDCIILQEGDRVPADATVIESTNISVDESLLTGESVPVRKISWDGKQKFTQPGGDDLPFIYSGSMVVSGRGIAKVTRTGSNTEIGSIGRALERITPEETLLKKETDRIVQFFLVLGLGLVFFIVVIYGLAKGQWVTGLLSGLTLAMAMLPEEFPMVLLIFLTLGAWRLSRRKVLTRRSAAIETLGAATVLCVDKTGTITQNMMHLRHITSGSTMFEVDGKKKAPETFHKILEYSMLASQADPFDPIEKEIHRIGDLFLAHTEHIHKNWTLVREYPLSKTLLSLSHVWKSPDEKSFVIATKGAPEAIIDLCHVSKAKKAALMAQVTTLTNRGQRVLGVARATFDKETLPKSQHDFSFEYIGLLGFADPVRPTVRSAVAECYRAGVRVIMITGDYPGTAAHIASEIGLANADQYITGPELSRMTEGELREKIKTINICARVVPEQKLLIVNALKANGEIVAMTGDGVNDAPALKAAHIGIAMGERGTDVAREASSIVLLNDDFSSIVAAVRLGRRIYDNLKKAMGYIFAVHIPIAGMSILPVIFNLPIVLLPAHIAFLELIIDPSCSTVFEAEPEDDDVMKRPPRKLTNPLFNRETIAVSLLQGISIMIVVMGVFLWYLSFGKSDTEARTLAFATLVIANIFLIVTNLSWSKGIVRIIKTPNKALWWVIGGALVALFLVNVTPFLRGIFHFTELHSDDYLLALAGGGISLLWFELLKAMKRLVTSKKLSIMG